jgi:hypothetical protein
VRNGFRKMMESCILISWNCILNESIESSKSNR